jgi:type IV pilus assembly protein PilA
MKSEIKAKFLQNLISKKKGAEGFTLIELLVVIIIVGVLAAIALPSFLNQIGKARGSEAKSTLGTLNRGQQAYRLEKGAFSTIVAGLDAKVTPKFYTYEVSGAPTDALTVMLSTTAATTKDSKGYSSAVSQSAATNTFASIICETAAPVAASTAGTAPASSAACAGTDIEVK